MSRVILTIAYFTFLEAARARLARIALLVLVAVFGGSLFVQAIAIADSQRIQTAFLAALLRPAGAFVLSLFVVTSLTREFSDKGLELILSLDIPRTSYVLGKQLGYMLLALLPAAVVTLVLAGYVPVAQAAAWGLSLLFELWIMAAFSLMCALAFTQAVPALSLAAGFYLLSRSMAAIQLIGHAPLAEAGMGHQFMVRTLDTIALLLPRLDLFAQTAWLLDGVAAPLGAVALQTAIYLALLLAAAAFDLARKEL